MLYPTKLYLEFTLRSQWSVGDAPAPATFGHIFWYCQVVQDFWRMVLQGITENFLTSVPSWSCGRSGAHQGSTHSTQSTASLRTQGVLYWKKKTATPSLTYWKGLINKVAPISKLPTQVGDSGKNLTKSGKFGQTTLPHRAVFFFTSCGQNVVCHEAYRRSVNSLGKYLSSFTTYLLKGFFLTRESEMCLIFPAQTYG